MRLRGGGLIGATTTPSLSAAPGVWSMADVLAARKAAAWPGGYSPEAQALFARFTSPPTSERKALIDNLIMSLKAAGVWQKLDALYVLAAHDHQAAMQNWVQNLYNLTAVASPIFTIDRGSASDGSSSYYNTGFNPISAPSPKFTQNNGHISVWDRTARAGADGYVAGSFTPTNNTSLAIWPRGAGNATFIRVSDAAATVTNANSDGFFVGSRTGATTRAAYRNGVSIGSSSEGSFPPPSHPLFVLARNSAGAPNFGPTDQLAEMSVGQGLSSGEQAAFYTALSTYLTAIGAS